MKTPPVFNKIKKEILGETYDLSFAFVTPAQMRKAMKYQPRRKVGAPTKASGESHISNVLAFPLSKTSGEILICTQAAKPFTVEFLFIHGLLHLKGFKHGATMERRENQILKKFDFQQLAIKV